MKQVIRRKKLIEVALPLDDINAACAREKSIRHGHPSMLHLWWARRPLAAARAVLFAQMIDDPSEHPELFPTEADQERERERLFSIIRDLVKWENTTNETVLSKARAEIRKSWRATCAENASHERASELFRPEQLPPFYDPFAGGGALPLEAQRLDLDTYASDLNPVAVLINKAMIEIPMLFSSRDPVNPAARKDDALLRRPWRGAQGLAVDVESYGQWLRDEAYRRVGHLYPTVRITAQMAAERADLKPLVGQELTVIAWLWSRTVKSPNPAFNSVDVPLVTTFMLSTKPGKEAYIEPIVAGSDYTFTVKAGKPADTDAVDRGTRTGGSYASFECILSGTPITFEYARAEARAGRMGQRLMAVVAEGVRGRIYLSPTEDIENLAKDARPTWAPDTEFAQQALGFRVGNYGLTKWSDLYTARQLVGLGTLSDLVCEARERIRSDALAAGWHDDELGIERGGKGASAYADAIALYLAFLVDQQSNQSSMLCGWNNINQQMIVTFSRQVIRMVWDFAECNIFSSSTGSFSNLLERQVKAIASLGTGTKQGTAFQHDAASERDSIGNVISTDPPYYDNIGYADLSDYFYVWLRHSVRFAYPDLFRTVETPKAQELVATPFRHGGKDQAEAFFLNGMTNALKRIGAQSHAAFPVTIYYAFKQAESKGEHGVASTGWEVFLEALIRAGFSITGTWPIKTESANKLKAQLNFLASCIVIVCEPRVETAPVVTLAEFLRNLKMELPIALKHLQQGNVAPVDLAQAAIGPGMAVFTRYLHVLEADGTHLSVRRALGLINQVLDELLAEQEGDFDSYTRFAIAWFEQVGFDQGEYGLADVLARAKNTSITGLVNAGIARSRGGKVSLIKPNELDDEWTPGGGATISEWEVLHQLIRLLERGGEMAAAQHVSTLGSKAEAARELGYRLYQISDRRKRASEALSYNGIVQSWPEIIRLSRDVSKSLPSQTELLGTL